jgi:hypothetical protein
MTKIEYYRILGLPVNSSIEDIKKAYRKKARLYHPDINDSPDAQDIFISITEAYDFLISNYNKILTDEQAYDQAINDWRKYRQDRSRKRATTFSRTSFATFKNTNFYKTTRIFDATTIILGSAVSILVLVFTLYGYIYRLHNPLPGMEKPSVFAFIMLLLVGLTFFILSVIYLRAYVVASKKHKKKYNPVA